MGQHKAPNKYAKRHCASTQLLVALNNRQKRGDWLGDAEELQCLWRSLRRVGKTGCADFARERLEASEIRSA